MRRDDEILAEFIRLELQEKGKVLPILGLATAAMLGRVATRDDQPKPPEHAKVQKEPSKKFSLKRFLKRRAPVDPKPDLKTANVPDDIGDVRRVSLSNAEKRAVAWNRLAPKAQRAAEIAKGMGLVVTAGAEGFDGDGVHASGSNHYMGAAVDVSGSPEAMARFYETMKRLDPGARELYYDPLGGRRDGQEVGSVGRHRNHVHYAG